MTAQARTLAFCTGVLLEQGRRVDRFSRPLTMAALIVVLVYPSYSGREPLELVGAFMLAAAAGLAEMYLAIRVAFDAALFHRAASVSDGDEWVELDEALTRLALLPKAKAGRHPEARVAGARRLFRFQIAALILQILLVLFAAGIAFLRI